MNTPPGTLRGFSLLEMILAVALVAVAAVLAMTTLAHIRTKANTVQCAQNLRQISTAVYLYATEHQGRYPPNRSNKDYWDQRNPAGVHHQDLLKPYLPSYQSNATPEEAAPWWCPADDLRRKLGKYFQHSYGIYGRKGGGDENTPVNRILAAEPNPSKALYFTDATSVNRSTCRIDGKSWPFNRTDASRPETAASTGVPWVDFRHGGRANILFVDGHVQSFRPHELNPYSPEKILH